MNTELKRDEQGQLVARKMLGEYCGGGRADLIPVTPNAALQATDTPQCVAGRPGSAGCAAPGQKR